MEPSGILLKVANISKKFEQVTAVDSVSIDISKGEFITLLGPSGSGKTTILLMIAGFHIPTSGEIFLKGESINEIPPYKRNIGIVFQSYALFPHLTVLENIAYPLRMRKFSKLEIKQKVESVLELVKLQGMEKRYPKQLSGGQQQRVALSRALVFSPDLLLMDEPLGALDKKMRDHMQLEIKHLQKELNITVIYVTHDQEEGLVMADRIAVLNKGKIEQVGSPHDLYENPSNSFIADFIGETNLLSGKIISRKETDVVLLSRNGLEMFCGYSDRVRIGETVDLSVRPEKIVFVEQGNVNNTYEGYVEDVIYIGEITKYVVNICGKEIIRVKQQNLPNSKTFKRGDKVKISWDTADLKILL